MALNLSSFLKHRAKANDSTVLELKQTKGIFIKHATNYKSFEPKHNKTSFNTMLEKEHSVPFKDKKKIH